MARDPGTGHGRPEDGQEAIEDDCLRPESRLRWIESYFRGGWPDDDDCAVIWKLAKGDPETCAKFAKRCPDAS